MKREYGKLFSFMGNLMERLTDEDINFILANQKEALGLITGALQTCPPVFKVIGQVEGPATAKNFVVADRFKVGTDGDVPFSYIGNCFEECFGAMVEKPATTSTLVARELQRPRNDGENIAALGGKDKAAITLYEFYEYLKTADRAKWYFAYVLDANGTLRCVNAYWHGPGWRVFAYSVDDPYRWYEGLRLVSRNY